jgi:hypothetical protein
MRRAGGLGTGQFGVGGGNVLTRRSMSANGHLPSHKQNKFPVQFIGLTQQTVELVQKSRIFA